MENWGRKYVAPISMASLPRQTVRALFIGNIAGEASKAFLDMDSLAGHLIMAGGSGAGKTTAAMIIAEECLMRDVAVLVLDVSKRWSNFKEKCASENMLKAYQRFGMESSRSFAAEETEIPGDDTHISISDFIESGALHFFNLGKMDKEQYNAFVRKSAQELISASGKRTKRLHTLVIIDDAYKLSPRFGGDAIATLEEARFHLKGSGIGLVLVTHSLTDFAPFGLGSVRTEIWFRTSQAEDFERARKRFGPEYAACLSNLRTGEGMVANLDFNYGRPWFVEFRPLLHKP
jgi:DNA helicase HerA-like ATPase